MKYAHALNMYKLTDSHTLSAMSAVSFMNTWSPHILWTHFPFEFKWMGCNKNNSFISWLLIPLAEIDDHQRYQSIYVYVRLGENDSDEMCVGTWITDWYRKLSK